MRLILSLLAAAGLAAGPASAAERSFPVTGFDKVAASGSEDVVITTGKAASVVATGPQDRIDRLDISVEKGTLRIRHKSGMSWTMGSDDVVIHVNLPVLHGVSASGSGNITADGGSGPEFSASLSGSGNLKLNRVDSPTVRLATAGSGDVAASGKCAMLDVRISGSGDMDLAKLGCASLEVAISGSGDVTANASKTANVRISGSGDVRVTGGARCTSHTSGSGSVDCG